jgi:hypothetical protein
MHITPGSVRLLRLPLRREDIKKLLRMTFLSFAAVFISQRNF